jgi:hypothetical protein
MVTDMYVFDLKTLTWEMIPAAADDSTPAQRYFHSADACECRVLRVSHLLDSFPKGTNISSYSAAWV